jgi:hypothetical protein
MGIMPMQKYNPINPNQKPDHRGDPGALGAGKGPESDRSLMRGLGAVPARF